MFFVADGTGGHAFAENYEQHQKNVARLRLLEQHDSPRSPRGAAQPTAPAVRARAARRRDAAARTPAAVACEPQLALDAGMHAKVARFSLKRILQSMALSSMTGFARGHGVAGAYAWAWELKSVNAKGLDLRLRLPPGWDAIEAPVRARARRDACRAASCSPL